LAFDRRGRWRILRRALDRCRDHQVELLQRLNYGNIPSAPVRQFFTVPVV